MIDDSVFWNQSQTWERWKIMAVFLDWLCVGVGLVWWEDLEAAQVLSLYFLFSLSDSWLLFFPFVTYKNVRFTTGTFLRLLSLKSTPGVLPAEW